MKYVRASLSFIMSNLGLKACELSIWYLCSMRVEPFHLHMDLEFPWDALVERNELRFNPTPQNDCSLLDEDVDPSFDASISWFRWRDRDERAIAIVQRTGVEPVDKTFDGSGTEEGGDVVRFIMHPQCEGERSQLWQTRKPEHADDFAVGVGHVDTLGPKIIHRYIEMRFLKKWSIAS